MRLLNCRTMQMEEFFDSHTPKYAILSHTWGEKEVSYQAFVSRSLTEGPGYEKIEGFCSLAAGLGYEWVWVDTCCIDKSSSAELSEAINSMFNWYKSSELCIIYLSDIDVDDHSNRESRDQAFRHSRWHTRGWTLQELLAPETAFFYDKTWRRIGSKSELASVINLVTKIPQLILGGHIDPRSLPVAERISWASNRKTSREEDIAYCLLGLLGVNMPLLYGEGRKAFTRLQEEVIRNTYDHTILAWGLGLGLPTSSLIRGPCLATSPDAFREWDAEIWLYAPRNHYLPTNLGLYISLPIIMPTAMNFECGLAILDCGIDVEKTLVLPLELDKRYNRTMFAWRARSALPFLARSDMTSVTSTTIPLYFTSRASQESFIPDKIFNFIMDLRCLFDIGYFLADFFPSSHFEIKDNHIFYQRLIDGCHRLLRFCHPSYVTILVMHEGCLEDPMRCGLQTAYITYPYTSWELILTRESIDVQQAYDSLSWSTIGYMNREEGDCYVGGLDFDDHEIAVIKSLPASGPGTYIRPIQPRGVPLQE